MVLVVIWDGLSWLGWSVFRFLIVILLAWLLFHPLVTIVVSGLLSSSASGGLVWFRFVWQMMAGFTSAS